MTERSDDAAPRAGRAATRPSAESAPPRGTRRGRKSRATLSLQAIIDGAIEMLDGPGGESALTFRGLAARLGGGVGSVYWYVKNKDELVLLAADAVIGRVMPTVDEQRDKPAVEAIRAIAIALFREMEAHPWTAAHFMHDVDIQENALLLWESLGQQALRLDLTDVQRFHVVSTVSNYVVGIGAQMSVESAPQPHPGEPEDEMRARYLSDWADSWLSRDPQQFPFAHAMAPVFREHDDFEQFTAGLDLILSGIERQAGLS